MLESGEYRTDDADLMVADRTSGTEVSAYRPTNRECAQGCAISDTSSPSGAQQSSKHVESAYSEHNESSESERGVRLLSCGAEQLEKMYSARLCTTSSRSIALASHATRDGVDADANLADYALPPSA